MPDADFTRSAGYTKEQMGILFTRNKVDAWSQQHPWRSKVDGHSYTGDPRQTARCGQSNPCSTCGMDMCITYRRVYKF